MIAALRNASLPIIGKVVNRPSAGEPDHVLVVQPDHLGDILLSQPAVEFVRRSYPGARITAVVGPWSVDAARLFWPVNEVLSVVFPGFQRVGGGRLIDPYITLQRETRRLGSLHAGQAVVTRPDAWWAAWLSSGIAPVVVGSDDPRVRAFATVVASDDPEGHVVERAWKIAAATQATSDSTVPTIKSNPLHAVPTVQALQELGTLRRSLGIGDHYVVIHPGSGARVKEWTVDRWRAVASSLAADGFSVVVTGAPSESGLADRIAEGMPAVVTIAGRTNLELLVAVLSRASLAIGPDCGPLHVAVATATRSIHLFGPSDPKRYGPWGDSLRHSVVSAEMTCSRCGDLSPQRAPTCGCMLAIGARDIIALAREKLSDATP